MNKACTIFLLLLLASSIYSQDIPQLATIGLPQIAWKILFFLLKFKPADKKGVVEDAVEVAQSLDGTWAVTDSGVTWKHSLPDADAKDYEWAKVDELIGVNVDMVVPSILPGTFLYLTGGNPYVIAEGTAVELANPSGSACLKELAANILMAMVAIDCNDELAAVDLEDVDSGWVPYANPPPGTPSKVAIDSLGVIWVVTTQGHVYHGNDEANGWTQFETEETLDCEDISVTLEGSTWLACFDEKGKLKVGQLMVPHNVIKLFKYETETVGAFHLASAAIIDSKDGMILESDIFGLNKKITKKLADFISGAQGDLPF